MRKLKDFVRIGSKSEKRRALSLWSNEIHGDVNVLAEDSRLFAFFELDKKLKRRFGRVKLSFENPAWISWKRISRG